MGSWVLCYPKALYNGTIEKGDIAAGKLHYKQTDFLTTNNSYGVTPTNEYGQSDDVGWHYTFPENPTRLDLDEKLWNQYFPFPFNDEAGMVINLGLDVSDLRIMVRLQSLAQFKTLTAILKHTVNYDGQPAMSTKDPDAAPLLLFMGDGDTMRPIYVDGWRLVRDGARGDNIWEVVIAFKDVHPHYVGPTRLNSYELDLTYDGTDYSSNAKLWIPALGAGGGQNTPDASGNGNVGTIYGATRIDTPFGAGLQFDGVNDFINVLDSPSLQISPNLTLLAWIKVFNTGGSQRVISKRNEEGTNYELYLNVDAPGVRPYFYNGSLTPYADFILNFGTWYHLAVVVNSSLGNITFFVNGVAYGSETLSISTDDAPLRIGGYHSGAYPFNGTIANVTILNTALTAAEILAKYNDEVKLFTITNSGKEYTTPSCIKITGATETNLVDQAQTSTDSSQSFGETDAAGKNYVIAQSFIATREHLFGIGFTKTASTGTNTGNVIIALRSDNSGNPSTTNLYTITISNATWEAYTNGEWQVISMPYRTTPGTNYHIRFECSTASDANHPNVARYNASNLYPEGSLKRWTTADGWVAVSQDLLFKTFYAEHSKNVGLYGEDDDNTVLYVGKETAEQEFTIDDGTTPLILDAANDRLCFTFQPTKTKLSKIMMRGKITGTAVGNCRVRLYAYDTTNNQPTGSALTTAYLSPKDASTTKNDIYVELRYGINDTNTMNTSGTYAVYFDDAQGDASNYWTFYGQTTSGLGDSDVGRVATSTNGGSTWSESTTVRGVLSTHYPNPVQCNLVSDAVISINGDGTGTYQAILTGSELVNSILEISGTVTTDSSYQPAFTADNDYVTYKFCSPFPMKNITLDYTVNPANNGIEIWLSTDNSSWELLNHVETSDPDDNVNQLVDLSSDYDNITALYLKLQSEGSTSAIITRAGITADIDTNAADMKIAIQEPSDTWYQKHDEISSGRAKIDVYYSERA